MWPTLSGALLAKRADDPRGDRHRRASWRAAAGAGAPGAAQAREWTVAATRRCAGLLRRPRWPQRRIGDRLALGNGRRPLPQASNLTKLWRRVAATERRHQSVSTTG